MEYIFRGIFILSGILMFSIRIYYQSKVLHDWKVVDVQESRIGLLAGGIAALVTIIFGLEYILSPGAFAFAYLLLFPVWLRWVGATLLMMGVALLWLSHHHLGISFHSLVVVKERSFVDSGPYRWIRHPIYSAYIMNYIGGGLLASNWVLTFIPVILFGVLVQQRVGREEESLIEQFGDHYHAYIARTGRFLPRVGSLN
jgi:protein-S-isoprenylcysteine O-methyltransferase Ste14